MTSQPIRLAALAFFLLIPFTVFAQTVVPPQVIESPAATYPVGRQESGTAVVLVTITAEGTIDNAESVSPEVPLEFNQAALEAVKEWKFAPARRDGVPFAARIRIPFIFQPAPKVIALPASPPAPSTPGTNGPGEEVEEVNVRGRQRKVDRGGSDFQIEIGKLSLIKQKDASDILQLAPGIFIANEGGEGHASQVFLRGFNAEQGQDIEFTVNGVPINEVNNPDGHGYADTHFIIPEVVKSLRVIEGPFDPHQGDFAVAGSADYELGVVQRGITLEGWSGSYNSNRLLLLYAPKGEREGTFAAAQFWNSAGYGVNRANSNASLMAQYEGNLGTRGLYRLLFTGYETHYKNAGVIRKDDYNAGRVDFYGTQDSSQGGDATRFSLSFDLENPLDEGVLKQQAFITYRTLRILENFTGFLNDVQDQTQSIHPQRGDGFIQSYQALTVGIRGGYRLQRTLLGHPQALEVGYYGRYDHTLPQIEQVRFGTEIPYKIDQDLTTDVSNLAGFIDLELNPFSWLSLRGGLRDDFFNYNVLNACSTAGSFRTGEPLNDPCPSYDASGFRSPSQRITASGSALTPKVTALVKLRSDVSLTGSYGRGIQSVDARYLSQDQNAPFSQLLAGEGGILYHRQWAQLDLSGRLVGYYTHVDKDLLFDPQLGRLNQTSGTTRRGIVAALRTTSHWFDELASFTYANATYDDTKNLVPYVPITIARSDTAVFGNLPKLRWRDQPFVGSLGLGINYIGPRALPFSQFASSTVETDASASLAWSLFKVGLKVTNLTNARYPLSQFNYVSDFHSRAYPTLVPTAHFTAAAPRILMLTFTLTLDPS